MKFAYYKIDIKDGENKDFLVIHASSSFNAVLLLQAAKGISKANILKVSEISDSAAKELLKPQNS